LFKQDTTNYTRSASGITRLKEPPAFKEPIAPSQPVSVPRSTTRTVQLTLDEAIDRYLQNSATKSGKTASGYSYTMRQFSRVCDKPVTLITQQDLINFVGAMRAEELSDRTISNRVGEVVTFLRANGVKDVTLRVRYTEKAVRSYREDELKTLFAAATPDERLMFNFYLVTGCREQEAMWAQWADVDFVDGIFTVKAKPGWMPKDCEVRELPLPTFLVDALKSRMLTSTGTLIFPSARGLRDGHMLRRLKELAARAGLIGDFTLHQFRRTYATLQHRDGTDARTIQHRLGHSDLTTTLRYLEGQDSRSERARAQVESTFGVFA
jgi:integrase